MYGLYVYLHQRLGIINYARKILFKNTVAVAAEDRAGQRDRCVTGAKLICCFTVS